MSNSIQPDAGQQLAATLTAEQNQLLTQHEQDLNDMSSREIGNVIDSICAHFPGLEPAVRALTDISHGDVPGGSCACGIDLSSQMSLLGPVAPADATPEWPVDEKHDLIIDDRLELLAGLCNHLPVQRAVLVALADHIASSGQDWPRCCGDLYPALKLTLL